MFRLLRLAIIVGVIFALSPERARRSSPVADREAITRATSTAKQSLDIAIQTGTALRGMQNPARQQALDEAVRILRPAPTKQGGSTNDERSSDRANGQFGRNKAK